MKFKVITLILFCLFNKEAYGYIEYNVTPNTNKMSLEDFDAYSQGKMSQEKLDKYMKEPLEEWMKKVKETSCNDYVEDFYMSYDFPENNQEKQIIEESDIVQGEGHRYPDIDKFIQMTAIQKEYFDNCINPTDESRRLSQLMTNIIENAKKFKNLEEYQAEVELKNAHKPQCKDIINELYRLQKYWSLDKKRDINIYDMAMYERNFEKEDVDYLREDSQKKAEEFSNCANPTKESQRLANEFKKFNSFLSRDESPETLIKEIVTNEYNDVKKILSSLENSRDSLRELEFMKDQYKDRPLDRYLSLNNISETNAEIYKLINDTSAKMNRDVSDEETKEKNDYNAKLIATAIEEQRKKLKKFDLPEDLLDSIIYEKGFTEMKPMFPLKGLLALLLKNPEIKSVSTKYTSEEFFLTIKQPGKPSMTCIFSRDSGDLFATAVSQNGIRRPLVALGDFFFVESFLKEQAKLK